MPKITSTVSGINEVRAAFRLLDTGLQARLRAVVSETTSEVERGAKVRVPVSGSASRKAKSRPGPGELRDSIRSETPGEGFVGFVKAGYGKLRRSSRAKAAPSSGPKRRRPARSLAARGIGQYAMVIEFGSPKEGKAPQPYMRPARQAAIPGHESRLRRAIKGAVTAAGGS